MRSDCVWERICLWEELEGEWKLDGEEFIGYEGTIAVCDCLLMGIG